MIRHSTTLAIIASSLFATALRAQELEPRHVKPVHVSHPRGGNGAAATWDGRVFVSTRNYANTVGWMCVALRPEKIATDASGVPDFNQGAFSDEVALELDTATGTNMGDHNALGLCPAPGFAQNPFRSQADGTPDPNGGYECYELTLVTQDYNASPNDMGMRRAHIVVSNPRTPNAAIQTATMLTPFAQMTTTAGQPLKGIEPTLAFDGHLLVWQGSPANDGSIDRIIYSFNQQPGQTGGWSTPRSIADMYHVDRATVVDGIAFQDRWPIAAQPLCASDGTQFVQGQDFHGAYPWISHDGTELFFAATVAGTPNVNRARRGFASVVGRWTGYCVRAIDGPMNPDREVTVRLFVMSPGAAPSFWRPFRDVPNVALPYTGNRPVFSIFGSNTGSYDEVSFEEFTDQDYVLALRMNECIKQDGTYDTTRTPDTSGNRNTGTLVGARFPQEYDGTDNCNLGALGQAIYFADGDLVRVPSSASLSDTQNAVTVQLWVKRLQNLHQDSGNHYKFLVNKPGSWNVILEQDGFIQCSVETTQGEYRSGALGQVPVGQWTHAAFSYDAGSGTLRTYVGGVLVGTSTFAPAPITTNRNDLVVGPGGQTPPESFVAAGTAVVMLDEVFVSRVVRSDLEVARAAFTDLPGPSFANGSLPLPFGLDPSQLRIPASNPVTQDAVSLGQRLFSETGLSKDGTMSCAKCHDPSKDFTDGLPKAQGLGGKILKRNTPVIVNRAFSTAQFLDGRAASLEDQALMPIQNPDEMGSNLGNVVAFLAGRPDYAAAFQKAYGTGPSPDTIGKALASFERTLLSTGSRYEQWQQGQGGLGASEVNGLFLFRGKARCVTCHSGSTFTDESFHNTAQTDGADGGRELVTGRRRFRGAFKTPTLRDVALTGPYLHDGSAPTIEAVIDLYDKGGNTATDRDAELRPLGLTDQEKADLAAFLRALSGNAASAPPPPPPPGSAPAPAPAPAPPGGDRLTNGATLQPGGTLTSQSGRYLLAMQGDGNLVIYDMSTTPWSALWASNTATGSPGSLSMQGDGNLVIYRVSDGTPTWASNTAGKGPGTLVMQNDGNLVIYSDVNGAPFWASNTAR